MRTNGWQGKPVDVVIMPDGSITSIDNTRILAARKAGIEIEANVRNFDDPIEDLVRKASLRVDDTIPNTWGEAAVLRINKPAQNIPKFNGGVSDWSQRFPYALFMTRT